MVPSVSLYAAAGVALGPGYSHMGWRSRLTFSGHPALIDCTGNVVCVGHNFVVPEEIFVARAWVTMAEPLLRSVSLSGSCCKVLGN